MVILGIDPGYGRVGWGAVDYSKNSASYLDCSYLETDSKLEFYRRLEIVYDEVIHLINRFHPGALALESLYFNTNAKTAILASHARGVISLAGIKSGVEVYDYTPLQVKQALIGYGRAEKKQIQTALKYHLRLTEAITQDDAADALAVALTHAYTNRTLI